jgi:hypothetical protein
MKSVVHLLSSPPALPTIQIYYRGPTLTPGNLSRVTYDIWSAIFMAASVTFHQGEP